jgi:uncharacterized Zn finger protein
MAWVNSEIVVLGNTIKSVINRHDDITVVEIPFADGEGISIGEDISIDGEKLKIANITNVGNRDETLSMEILNDKSIPRGTRSKSRKQDLQDQIDD